MKSHYESWKVRARSSCETEEHCRSLANELPGWASSLCFYGVILGTFLIAVTLPASSRWAGLRSRLRVKKHTWEHLLQEWVTPAALTAHLITNIWCTKSTLAPVWDFSLNKLKINRFLEMKAMIECLIWNLGADVFFFVLYLSGSLALHYSWPLYLSARHLLTQRVSGLDLSRRPSRPITSQPSTEWHLRGNAQKHQRHLSLWRSVVWAYLSVTRLTFRWLRKQEVWLTPHQLKLQPFNHLNQVINLHRLQ